MDIVEFNPPIGVLVTRVHIYPSGHTNFDICFCTENGDFPNRFCQIARIRDFNAEPYISGFFEMVRGQVNVQPFVHRHFTTFDEICALKRLWDSRWDVQEWLDEVMKQEALLPDEKDRINLHFGLKSRRV